MRILMMLAALAVFLWLQRKLYRRFWDSKLSLDLRFPVCEAHEGDTLPLIMELANAKLLPMPWVTVNFQTSKHLWFTGRVNARVTDACYQNDLFCVNMYQKITRRLRFVCGKRGFYQIKEGRLESGDILLTERLVKYLTFDTSLTVYPRLVPTEGIDPLCRRIYGLVATQNFINPDPFAFRGIRDYELSDSLRSVNFKASAKTNKLMVNVYHFTGSRPLLILLNTQAYSPWPDETVLEAAISLAASLAARFAEDGTAVGLLSNARDVESGATVSIPCGLHSRRVNHIWEALARLDLSTDTEAICPALERLYEPETVYVLISPYHGSDLQDAVERMTDSGLDVYWIIPAHRDMAVAVEENDRVSRWEVERL